MDRHIENGRERVRIFFNSRGYELPDPVPIDTEIIVRPERIGIIPSPKNPSEQLFSFSNPIRKFLFFMLREGPRLAYRKARTALFTRKMLDQQKVLFVFGKIEHENEYAIAVGQQYCPLSELMIFPRQYAMLVSTTRDIEKDYQNLLIHFQHNPKDLESLAAYSPFSGLLLDFNLEQTLAAGGHTSPCSMSQRRKSTESMQSQDVHKTPTPTVKKLSSRSRGEFDLFLAGAGAYAYSYILPSIVTSNVRPHTVIDLNPILACYIAEKFRFPFHDTSSGRALKRLRDVEKPLLIIATYHSTHVPIAEEALSINPRTRIFIEKPPATTMAQVARLISLREQGAFIEIGYNRRHIPLTVKTKQLLASKKGPATITCIIREKSRLPLSHWYYWPTQGTRAAGNLSHWIDLGYHLIEKKPVSMICHAGSTEFIADEPVVSILFEDSSLLNIVATDKGDTLRGVQEYIDIRRENLSIQIDDFLHMSVREEGLKRFYWRIIRDKGHLRMYKNLLKVCETEENPGYPDRDLYVTTKLYLDIKDVLLRKQRAVNLFGYEIRTRAKMLSPIDS